MRLRARIAQAEAATFDVEDALAKSAEVRGMQANLTFFAFTATPKSKTLEMFGERITAPSGEPRYVAFHLYSMRQAIEEGFILDVLANYTTYRTYYRLANGLRPGDDPMLRLHHRLATPQAKALYAKRKTTSEPVFGVIKHAMGLRQFLMRGLAAVSGEWQLASIAWNLRRMHAMRLAA